MIIPHVNINNSSKYKPDLSHVSGFTRKINLTYFPWKPKLPKYTSSSTAYSTKLSTERKILSFAKPQFWQRHQMNKIVIQFVCFFHSGVKKLNFQTKKMFTCNIRQKKCFANFRMGLINMKLLKKVFVIYSKVISCI